MMPKLQKVVDDQNKTIEELKTVNTQLKNEISANKQEF